MVSIIILSYNTEVLLRECLKSLYTTLSSMSFEVIVLDNASSDGSVSMVRDQFKRVILIESEKNLGFAKGVNTAAERAKGDYLLFLNSDANLLDRNLSEMVKKMEKDHAVAVVGGNLLNRDGTTSEAFGRFYNLPEVFSLLFLRKKAIHDSSKEMTPVDWVSGGYMVIRREAFEKVGGFDEGFFMYIEDMDLCYRLRRAGLHVLYYKEAKARHVGQGSSNRMFAIVNIYKGLLYFYKKQKPQWQYFVVKLLLTLKAVAAYVVGVIKNDDSLKATYAQALRVTL